MVKVAKARVRVLAGHGRTRREGTNFGVKNDAGRRICGYRLSGLSRERKRSGPSPASIAISQRYKTIL